MLIVTGNNKTYKDLLKMFGSDYEMPPETEYYKYNEIEYRCPYIPKCPTGAKCFSVATPKLLDERDVLYVKCRLCGNRKIPFYAGQSVNKKY